MMPLTAYEIRELREVVAKHWTGFMIRMYGPEAVGATAAEVDALVRAGILDRGAAAAIDPLQDAYLLGVLRHRMREAGLDPLTATWAQIKDAIAARPTPLAALERAGIAAAKQSAGVWAAGLGNRMANDILSATNVEDMGLRDRMLEIIQDEVATSIERRETARTLASRLADITQDYARDWQRLATSELHTAQEQGAAQTIAHEFGAEARVAKIPNPDACPACKAAYLDTDGRPKIFSLKVLRANGTNAGRRQKEWRPTIDAHHPWCHCRLVFVPDGFDFTEEWQLVPVAESKRVA